MTKERAQILVTLQGPHRWRTLGGICRETGLAREVVGPILEAWSDEVVIYPTDEWTGPLYASRTHLKKTMGFWEKMAAAFRNRIYL